MGLYLRQVLALWQSDDDTASGRVQRMGGAIALGCISLCFMLVMNALTFKVLADTWLDARWHNFWMLTATPLRFYWFMPMIAIASSSAAREAAQPPLARRVWKLRQAALDGDDERAPVERERPEPFAEGELPAAVEIIPRLRPLTTLRPNLAWSGGVGAIFFAALLACGTAFSLFLGWSDMSLVNTGGDFYAVSLIVSVAIALVAVAALFAYGVMLIRRAPRRCRRMDPVVDPWGVRWIAPTRQHPRQLEEQHIRWEDVRAFYHISYHSTTDYVLHTIYFLDTGDTLLAWEIALDAWDELLDWNERFLRIIATYTKLPLRNLSDAADELGKSLLFTSKLTQAERRAAARAAREARRNRPRRKPSVTLVAASVAVVALMLMPMIAGWHMQRIQHGYYDGLAARALAHRPLFTDSLARPDGLWPVKAPDGGLDSSYSYQSGAYQITGGPADNTVDATLPATYGDAAIQVSARQSGSNGDDGVGLILRDVESGGTHSFVAFWILPDGGWRLECVWCSGTADPAGQWTELASSNDDSSHVSPVHPGLGAANTILVLMRGDEIICYVNGEWVVAARDDGIPAAGQVGVYLDDDANTGIFSDFAVYPAA